MFRPSDRPFYPKVLWITSCILLLIILATIATIWLAAMVQHEQLAIADIIKNEPSNAVEHLKTWQAERRWEVFSIAIDVFVLIITAVALFTVTRAYFGSQKTLQQVKTLAWDILASIDQAVLTTDSTGRITSMNPNIQELLSIERTSLGQMLTDVCNDQIPLAEIAHQVITHERSVHDTDFALARRGVQIRLRADGHLLRDTANQVIGVALYVRDVTERVLIEERMRRMERFMGLGTLAAGLHHEIKNPLSALSLHVQLLEERLAKVVDKEVGENLGVLKTEVTRINGVLESFRDFASLEHLNLSQTNLADLLKQTVELVRPKADQQQVQLSIVLPSDSKAIVSLDAARFEQVLLNLVINALEAMPVGGQLRILLEVADNGWRIRIEDTGHGIPENLKPRIFDPYFTTKTDGSGMGLAICDKVMQQHGGQIEVETGPTGTTFHIFLPTETN